jgi:hypothetical protein
MYYLSEFCNNLEIFNLDQEKKRRQLSDFMYDSNSFKTTVYFKTKLIGFLFFGNTGLNSGPHTCKAGSLPLAPFHSSFPFPPQEAQYYEHHLAQSAAG